MTGASLADLVLVAFTCGLVGVVAAGVGRAARLARFGQPRRWTLGFAGGFGAWLAATAALAGSGVLAEGASGPPRVVILPLLAVLTLLGLMWTSAAARLLSAVPAWQPVAVQVFRVGVEWVLWRLHAEGRAPVQVTFEGRNLDMLVGLSAPLVAAGIALGRIGPRATIAWNLAGLALLANAIGTVATSLPGPLHLDWPGEPFTAPARWPVVWIPALLAPVALVLHIVSIRQSLRRTAAVTLEISEPR